MFTVQTILFALFGGILPAVLWLWFWLKEDRKHPEPGLLVFLTFIYGAVAVVISFIFQFIISKIILNDISIDAVALATPIIGTLVIILWAGTEEYFKYKAAKIGALQKDENDEPVDFMIYMITAALGFAAIENALFIISPLIEGNSVDAFLTGNLRFIGATLLHVASSAIIGIFGALSFFFKSELKKLYIFIGFILATALHTIFNLFIIKSTDNLLLAFALVWLLIIIIIVLFEKIKNIHLNKIKI